MLAQLLTQPVDRLCSVTACQAGLQSHLNGMFQPHNDKHVKQSITYWVDGWLWHLPHLTCLPNPTTPVLVEQAVLPHVTPTTY